jgi:PAS domain S-box-containing protein
VTSKPSCESARLEALHRYEILGTLPDPAFDDLARLASYICHTPIAAISFVDAERQWFKSAVGLNHREAPREGAFCAHTILGTDVFIVEKADEDERFSGHPWVVEPPALRFYAGIPLISPDGYAIGTLAVMDAAPRTLSPEQQAFLRTITNQVMAQLELRKTPQLDNRRERDRRKEFVTEQKEAEEIIRESELKLRSIFDQAPVGIATINSLTGRFKSVNPSYSTIIGYTVEEMLDRTFLDITHPDDLQSDLDQMTRLLEGEIARFEMDKRLLKKNGDVLWVHLTCVPLWRQLSDPRMHLAIVQDMSERKRAEEKAKIFHEELARLVESRTKDLQQTHRLLQSVIDSSPDWIFVKDREHRFVLVNQAFAASQQLTPEDMANRLDNEFWSHELCEGNEAKGIRGFHTDDRRAFAGELIHNPYDPASLHDGTLRIFDTYKGPWRGPNGEIAGVLCYARDVTEQRRAEEVIKQLNSELAIRVDERTAELARTNQLLEIDIADRKQAEKALQSSQENLRQALQASNTGLWSWDTETNDVSFSREWKRQLGYEEAEIVDVFESWETRLHPDDHAQALEYVRAYLAKPVGNYHQEFRLRHKDGTYRWIEARASFVTESDGQQVRLLGSHSDLPSISWTPG